MSVILEHWAPQLSGFFAIILARSCVRFPNYFQTWLNTAKYKPPCINTDVDIRKTMTVLNINKSKLFRNTIDC